MAGIRWGRDDDAALLLAVRAYGPYDYEGIAAKLREANLTPRTEAAIQQRLAKGPKTVRQGVQEAVRAYRTAQMEQEAPKAVETAPVPMEPDHPQLLRSERKALELEAENRSLKAKVKALQKEHGLFEQVAGVVREVSVQLPTLGTATHSGRSSEPAVEATSCDFVLILADEHADEVVSREATWGIEQYDFGIFRCRLQRLRNLVREYASQHLPKHQSERLWIFKLGDSVNGDIHGHGPKNHFRNTIKSAIAVGDAEAQFVQSLIPYFPQGVHVVGVSGNHPRRSEKKDYEGPHDNFDYLVGVQMATRLQEEIHAGRCSVTLPESWSAYVQVRDMLWGLSHGDDTTGYTGLPWVGFDRRNNRVQTLLGRVERRADAFCYGHYHTPASFPSAGAVSFHSGCWTAADPYAINRLAAGGEPQQTLVVVGDKPRVRGILLPIPLYTRHEETEALYREGKYTPELGQETALDIVTPPRTEGLNVIQSR